MKKELKEDLERMMAFVPNKYTCGDAYVEGWKNEANEMRKAIDSGIKITEHWLARNLTVSLSIPTHEIGEWERQYEQYKPRLFFDGSCVFRSVAMDLVRIYSFDNPTKEMMEFRNRIFTEIIK